MKNPILILLSLLFFTEVVNCQKIELGNDTTFCGSLNSNNDKFQVARNIKYFGDTSGIVYLWSCTFQVSSRVYTAKDILSTITVSNPVLSYLPSRNTWYKFFLTVTQGGNVFKDSINLRISGFLFTSPYFSYSLLKGDSIILNQSNIGGGIDPLKFIKWEPEIGLINASTFPTFCKNFKDTHPGTSSYTSYFKDSVGCRASSSIYDVTFLGSVTGLSSDLTESIRFLSKNNSILIENSNCVPLEIYVYDINGIQLVDYKTKEELITLNYNQIPSDNLLIVKIIDLSTKKISSFKFLIKQ